MNPMLRRIAAVFSMVFGCAGVAGLVYYMNELNQPPKPPPAKVSKDFKVEKQPHKKQRQRTEPRPKPQRATQVARHAPPPSITTSLSGLSFDLPQFENNDVLRTDELLGGAGANDKLVMTEDTVDSLPRPRSRPAPEYPAKARQRGIQGHVLLKLKVSERGEVEQVSVVEAEPAGVFESVAVAAVRQWTFEPARYKGEPVALTVSQRIPFRLN